MPTAKQVIYHQCVPHTRQMPNPGVTSWHVAKPELLMINYFGQIMCHWVQAWGTGACLIPPKAVNKIYALWHSQLFQVPCERVHSLAWHSQWALRGKRGRASRTRLLSRCCRDQIWTRIIAWADLPHWYSQELSITACAFSRTRFAPFRPD